MSDLSGTLLKGYELRERIGTGGYGVVYRGYETSLGRDVAIKIILPQFADHPDFISHFVTEAQHIARLEHPSITPLYKYWREPGEACLIMRWLRGGDLRHALQSGPLSVESAAHLLDQITAALHTAHRNKIVHLDVKPENILFDEDGNAYLTDFSIARNMSVAERAEAPSDVLRRVPNYLSPEQVRRQVVSPLTDIYALGVVLYEVLTGQHPFPDVLHQAYKHANDLLPPVSNLSPKIAVSVNTVIQRATAKTPSHRYPDVLSFALAFREAAQLNRPQGNASVIETLTLREQEILQLIIQGKSNSKIAEELFLAVSSVKSYIKPIYKKLRVRNRVQAIVRARELQLILPTTMLQKRPVVESAASNVLEPENPYKGLHAFQIPDSRDFFGRETMIQILLERMAEVQANRANISLELSIEQSRFTRFLAVIGPSGSGKSSLIKAGLLPALLRGALPNSSHWFVAEMLPTNQPLEKLSMALARLSRTPVPNLRDELARDHDGLLHAAQMILPDDDTELVLFIDQFEEIFTLVEDETARSQFLNSLVTAVTDPQSHVRIVITLRADFYDRPLHYSKFGEMVRSRMLTILPLTTLELEHVIARPAEQVEVTFESGLIARIIADVNDQPGALPLLQFTLTELFERRVGRLLTHEAYETIGGAVGALAKQAQEIYEKLNEPGKKAACQMFLRLITLGEGVEDTRRRVPRSELMSLADEDVMDDLIDTYTSYRLLSLDYDSITRLPTVEIAHETLIRAWKHLSIWLGTSRRDLLIQRQLLSVSREWAQTGRNPGFLATGVRLAQFESLAETSNLVLSEEEHAYLRASVAEHERGVAEHDRQKRRLLNLQRGIIGVLAGSLLIAIALSVLTLISRSEALSQARIALSRQLAAQAVAELQKPIGNDEFAALLAIRALSYEYDAVADSALVEAAARLPLRGFKGHTDIVYDVAFSPDGKYALTGSADHIAILWDVATGHKERSFTGHSAEVYTVAFSPDGRYILTGSEDHTAILWDATTGEEVRAFIGHNHSVNTVVFSPDGQYILTASENESVRLWQTDIGKQIRIFADSNLSRGIAFSPDGAYIVTDQGFTTTLWETATGNEVRVFAGHSNSIFSVAFSPDGQSLLTGSIDNTAILWDLATGNMIYTLRGHSSSVRSVAFSLDGTYIATGSSDRTVRLWNATTGEEVHNFRGHLERIWSVAFSPDGQYVLSGSADHTAKLWQIAGDPTAHTLSDHHNEIYDVAFSPDGQFALTGSADHMAKLWQVATGQEAHTFSGHSEAVYGVAFSPDGQFALTGSADHTAKLWQVATGQEAHTFSGHSEAVYGVAFSPDGQYALTGSADYVARLWDTATGQELRVFSGHSAEIYGVAFSPDGNYILTASADATVRLWDIETGKELLIFRGHDDAVNAAVFSSDGRFVLSGSSDFTVRLWNVTTGQVVRVFSDADNTIYNVAFSPDDRSVLAGSADRTARLWDSKTGAVVRILRGHGSAVWGAAYSADGKYLLTGSLDGTAKLWEANYPDFVASVCARLLRDFTKQEREEIPIADQDSTCS